MNRATLALYLAVIGAAWGCSAEDPLARPVGDAGARDAKGSYSSDVRFADRLDASGGSYADDGSSPPPPPPETPDSGEPPDVVVVPDARPDLIVEDPPLSRPDVLLPDGPSPPDVVDATSDPTSSGICLVTFTVSGVDFGDAAAAGRVVRLVGDLSTLGAWTPASGVALTETATGSWSGQVTFRHLQSLEFKFVKMASGLTPEWESWTPYDSNRSMLVDCGDGGSARPDAAGDPRLDDTNTDATRDAADDTPSFDIASDDAANDATPSDAASDGRVIPAPAVGKSYTGVFGVRPADATK